MSNKPEQPVFEEIATTEQEQTSVTDQMWELLEKRQDRGSISPEIKAAQQRILENLPSDFWRDFKGHLIARDYERALYHRELKPEDIVGEEGSPSAESIITAETSTEAELGKVGSGELFEALVRADEIISPENETPLAEVVRRFMADPDRFNLPFEHQLGHRLRNPDLATVNEQGEITGWTECKAGVMNARAAKQLAIFETHFQQALNLLQEVPDDLLEKHGLESLAGVENKGKLTLATELDLRLAVPRGAHKPKNLKKMMRMSPNSTDGKRLLRILESGVYKIVESPFSRGELRTMLGFLVFKFKEEVKTSTEVGSKKKAVVSEVAVKVEEVVADEGVLSIEEMVDGATLETIRKQLLEDTVDSPLAIKAEQLTPEQLVYWYFYSIVVSNKHAKEELAGFRGIAEQMFSLVAAPQNPQEVPIEEEDKEELTALSSGSETDFGAKVLVFYKRNFVDAEIEAMMKEQEERRRKPEKQKKDVSRQRSGSGKKRKKKKGGHGKGRSTVAE